MTSSTQNVGPKTATSDINAPRNANQFYMIISFKGKRHDTCQNRIKKTKKITRKLKHRTNSPYWQRVRQTM